MADPTDGEQPQERPARRAARELMSQEFLDELMARVDAVDQHDPPDRMRETVVLRDRHCMFPWCRHHARACDLDHIIPYLPIDRGGPPGQTAPSKLAPLGRRHDGAKTSRRWRYERHRDGTYTCHGPHGCAYRVTREGTSPADGDPPCAGTS